MFKSGGINRIYANSNQTRLYALANQGRYYVTTDGMNWSFYRYLDVARNESSFFDYFEPNPVHPDNVVAIVATDCSYNTDPDCETTRWDIIVSNDGAQSWVRFDSFVAYWFYGKGYTMYITEADTIFIDADTIWYAAFPTRVGGNDGDEYVAWFNFLVTTPSYQTAPRLYIMGGVSSGTPVGPNTTTLTVDTASWDGEFLWALEAFNFNGSSQYDLFISGDKGQTFSYAQIPPPPELPEVPGGYYLFNQFPENRAFFLRLLSFPSYVGANGSLYDGDLWLGDDERAGKFTWSLSRVYSGQLYDVRSSPNVMIANHYSTRVQSYVETVITFNKGNTWSLIPAPANHSYDCTGECYLHLMIEGTSIHSEPRYPGFVVANGNVGRYLNVTAQSVFVSLDGGLNWQQALHEFDNSQPTLLFDIAIDGSLFVSLPTNISTSRISYSATGGIEWDHCEFENSTIPTGVFSVATGKNNSVLVLSSRSITFFDFNAVLGADCSDEDYEIWSPSTNDGGCVLGQRIEYYRVKTGVACYNPIKAGQVANITTCECAFDDFSCAQCFFWNQTANDCSFSVSCDREILQEDPPSGCYFPSTYTVSYSGFQKLAGSVCTVGKYNPTNRTRTLLCPYAAPIAPLQPPAAVPIALPVAPPRQAPVAIAAPFSDSSTSSGSGNTGAIVGGVIGGVIGVVLLAGLGYWLFKHRRGPVPSRRPMESIGDPVL